MRLHRPLTKLAQQTVAKVLQPGGRAIDATMGNGQDTLFMARLVAPHGQVIAFDIQPDAVANTRAKLVASQLDAVVELHLCGHEHLLAQVPADWAGKVTAVMFNLGYLPGGDKTLITRADTTVRALQQGLTLLAPGGLISLMLYRGHTGASSETAAVRHWLDGLDSRYRVSCHESPGPVLYLIERRQ